MAALTSPHAEESTGFFMQKTRFGDEQILGKAIKFNLGKHSSGVGAFFYHFSLELVFRTF